MSFTPHLVTLLLLFPVACGRDNERVESGSPQSAGASGGGGQPSTPAGGGTAGIADDVAVTVDGEFPIPLREGLAPTPPMGWSSWNKFGCNITADDVKAVADAMVSNGMKAAGYQYLNIDDCWQQLERAADGSLQPDPDFPDGLAALADYVHERGLKLGLYSDRGTRTCAGRAGAEGYESIDAETYAAWGIDYLKYDNCYADATQIQAQYQLMRDELGRATASTGRPIVYSLCAWQFYEWGPETGQLWRTTSDITATWSSGTSGSVLGCARRNAPYAAYAGPNGWNDPDMLEVGNAMTFDEQRSHMYLWAMMAAPLIAGNDVTSMNDQTRSILLDSNAIAIDQDAYGLQAVIVQSDSTLGTEVWAKPLNAPGERAVLLLNTGSLEADITVDFDKLGLGRSTVNVTNLTEDSDLYTLRDSYTAKAIAKHASVLLKVTGIEPPLPTATTYLSDLTWLYAANGKGPVERDQTNGLSPANDGNPIVLDGTAYEKGLGMQAPAAVLFRLGKNCSRLQATIGVPDDITSEASVVFKIYGDGELLYESPTMTENDGAEDIDIDVSDIYRLKLFVGGAGSLDIADRVVFADARLVCQDL